MTKRCARYNSLDNQDCIHGLGSLTKRKDFASKIGEIIALIF